jgi:GDP-L-fucose synthase
LAGRESLRDLPFGFINVGAGQDLSIRELAALIAEIAGYRGGIRWDPSKPNGTPRKLLDSSRMLALGWKPRIGLRAGIAAAYRWYQESGA